MITVGMIKNTLLGIAIVALFVFAFLLHQDIQRLVKIGERMDARVEIVFQGMAPLGSAMADKGLEAITNMDTKALSAGATKGVSEVGQAAKKETLKLIGAIFNQERVDKASTVR